MGFRQPRSDTSDLLSRRASFDRRRQPCFPAACMEDKAGLQLPYETLKRLSTSTECGLPYSVVCNPWAGGGRAGFWRFESGPGLRERPAEEMAGLIFVLEVEIDRIWLPNLQLLSGRPARPAIWDRSSPSPRSISSSGLS